MLKFQSWISWLSAAADHSVLTFFKDFQLSKDEYIKNGQPLIFPEAIIQKYNLNTFFGIIFVLFKVLDRWTATTWCADHLWMSEEDQGDLFHQQDQLNLLQGKAFPL